MGRIARALAAGYPHHVLQRGNYRQPVFEEDADYRHYLSMIGEYGAKFGLSIWAYCLMSDHVHYICLPAKADTLSKTLNILNTRYSRYFNDKKQRHGHLWQSRFFSNILDERHALEAMRFCETNPLRKGLVADATAYRWSSARAHALGIPDALLQDGCPILPAAGDWKSFLDAPGDQGLIQNIRINIHTGRPCGDREFVRMLESLLHRSLTPRLRGRPRK